MEITERIGDYELTTVVTTRDELCLRIAAEVLGKIYEGQGRGATLITQIGGEIAEIAADICREYPWTREGEHIGLNGN